MKFFISPMNNCDKFEITANPNDTIALVKKIAHDKCGIPIEAQVLMRHGSRIRNDSTISSLNLKEQETINMLVHVSGGALFKFRDVLNTSEESRVQRGFVDTAPDYRAIVRGLNLEARCKTPSCSAYKKLVWVNYGFGEFNIGKIVHKCKCPECKQTTEEATNVGYYKTSIKVEGKKQNEQIVEWSETVNDDKLLTFVDKESTMCNWNYLEIVASQL